MNFEPQYTRLQQITPALLGPRFFGLSSRSYKNAISVTHRLKQEVYLIDARTALRYINMGFVPNNSILLYCSKLFLLVGCIALSSCLLKRKKESFYNFSALFRIFPYLNRNTIRYMLFSMINFVSRIVLCIYTFFIDKYK